ncbi:hypothetical protein M2132_002390 [Dysgonomonas sp. PH5-45]|uniref:DUF349 domain-containing protein n=1 Tax=unclassified Dysgonomonas TaxID=2630389 RepID=UPI002475CCD6|nr:MULTISPECIES: DUF349 domain-containing protein [unclassified Dysgonomonas]MDH6356036.1 hypothetical protein [Dysgonomonas sp. PH5-45]MDH6388923.1 hypothetical protein [Dysgonomonas sp. PH5-37]
MTENLAPELSEDQQAIVPESKEVDQPTEAQLETSEESKLTVPETKEEIIACLDNLAKQEAIPTRADVDTLKQAFYKIKTTEINELKEKFIADGGDVKDFEPAQDPLEDQLKELLNNIKEKRAKAIEAEDKLRAENLAKKLQIIDKIKDLTESTDDFNKLYKEFKDLQQQWNEIKAVPAGEVNNLWKSYQVYTEKFYDLIKINNEFRDYDFKKNLELKTQIIESTEKLLEESDIVSAFHQLQNFHQQWREIGPVVKELREEIWDRFKSASTEINKRYQAHFEGMKAQEENNLAEKNAICDALKAIDYDALNSYNTWDEKSKEVIELQAKWKTIGFVPRKINSQIFEQFRALCDTFFEKKAEFFKVQRDRLDENLEKKRALLEKAKALKDSTDWSKTTDELIAIQKEWKTIGAVPRKYSDAIWKEFVSACDHFFEEKKKVNSSQREEEEANLAKKNELIEKINAVDIAADPKKATEDIYAYIDEWHQIGFVPFKEKDKIYKAYQKALDTKFDLLKVDRSERRMQNFRSNLESISSSDKPKNALYKEREKLQFQFNKIKSELQTYENNMGFLSVSKGSGGLLKEMNKKIEDLKAEMDLIAKKVESIDANISELDKN